MHVIEHTYECLLSDVAEISSFSEIRGLKVDLQWCLKTAPQLEKQFLEHLEAAGTEITPTTRGHISVDSYDSRIELKRLCRRLAFYGDGSMCRSQYNIVSRWIEDEMPKELWRLAHGAVYVPLFMRLLRQLLLFSYKASVPHEASTQAVTYEQYIQTSQEVLHNDLSRSCPVLLEQVRKHVQSVLYACDWGKFSPSHGPGASTSSKDRWETWYPAIEKVFPYSPNYLLYNMEHLAQCPEPSDRQISCKVTAVPKDSRGPRLVCVHPAEAIWAQQGARRVLERAIVKVRQRRQGKSWPHGHIFFDDQTVNGSIALLSSFSRKFATIDLAEASDRLSEPLVAYLFGRYYKYFSCSRALEYVIEGKSYPMASYAPMGNATVFPVQSLVFWAICVASMRYRGMKNPSAAFVFGDDILVPTVAAPSVCEDLESFGLKVNRRKTFIQSSFRESCGVDAYNGFNVTPVRWKAGASPKTLVELQSLSDMAMRLRIAKYEMAAAHVYSYIWRTLWLRCGKVASFTNNQNHGGIAEYTPRMSLALSDAVWRQDHQWYESPVWKLKLRLNNRSVSDWNHVLESLLSLERTGMGTARLETASRQFRLIREWITVL